MTDELFNKAKELKHEIGKLEHIYKEFRGFMGLKPQVRIGKVKRIGTAFYTINNSHGDPVNEIIIPVELSFKIAHVIGEEIIKKKRELEEL